MRNHYLAICPAFLVLFALNTAAQDTTCENFEVETIACNDPPFNSCSSRTALPNVIIGDLGSGCKHPETEPLTCPGGSSCPGTTYQQVAVDNPYCTTLCGCGGDCSPTCCNGGIQCAQREYCDLTGGCDCVNVSPIIVDTTGRGFHLTSAGEGVNFDMAGNGQAIKLSWTDGDSGNAFLALDRNHNGQIDSGKELFGNFTAQPKSDHPNGYLALAEFDKPENGGNADGIIDGRDAIYSSLLLWIDANHDGISQPSELHTLPELGVFSIGLNYKDDHHEDQYGNLFHYRSALNPKSLDGTSQDGRWTYDVFFVTDKTTPGTAAANCAAKNNRFTGVGIKWSEKAISVADHTLNQVSPPAKPGENRYASQDYQQSVK